MSTKTKPVDATTEPKFTKDSLVNAKVFCRKRDLVSAILQDGVEYTVAEAEALIADYLKGKVN